MCYYRILGVARDASKAAIKSAYLKSVKKHHPDVSKSTSSVQFFHHIQEAYSVLSDEQKRKDYDMKLGIAKPSARPERWESSADEFSAFFNDQSEQLRRERERTENRGGARRQSSEAPFMGARKEFTSHKYLRLNPPPLDFFFIFFQVVPLLLFPSFIFYLVFQQLRVSQKARRQGPIIRYDSYGHAYFIDNNGRMHRMFEFDVDLGDL